MCVNELSSDKSTGPFAIAGTTMNRSSKIKVIMDDVQKINRTIHFFRDV